MSTIALPHVVAKAPRSRAWYLDVWIQMLRRKPLGTVGAVIVIIMLAAAALADLVSPYGFAQTSLPERFISMNASHWLGTDQLGRDLLTRLMYGARISLYVGFGAVVLGSVLATLVGVLSAYFGGRVDLFLQRVVDAWMAFPPLLLLLSIMSLLGPTVFNITAVLGIAFGIQNSRIIRGVALSIKEYTFVERARARLGAHAHHREPHPAERSADHHRRRDDGLVDRHPHGSEPFVSRPRRAAAVSDVGRHALAGGARLHVPGALARDLARRRAVPRGLRLQHAGRRPAGFARPEAEGALMMMTRATLLFALGAGVAMAIYSIFLRLGAKGIHPALGTAVVSGVAFVVNFGVILYLKGTGVALKVSTKSVLLLAVVGAAAACADLLSLSAYSSGLKVTSSFVIGGTSAVLVLVAGFLFLREPFSWTRLVAIGLIAVGIFLLQREGL